MVSHVQGILSVADGSGGMGHLGGGRRHSQLFPMLDNHMLDLIGLLILGRGIGVGGGFLDTSLLHESLLGGLRVAWVFLRAFPLFCIIRIRPGRRFIHWLLMWGALELREGCGEGGIVGRFG